MLANDANEAFRVIGETEPKPGDIQTQEIDDGVRSLGEGPRCIEFGVGLLSALLRLLCNQGSRGETP